MLVGMAFISWAQAWEVILATACQAEYLWKSFIIHNSDQFVAVKSPTSLLQLYVFQDRMSGTV